MPKPGSEGHGKSGHLSDRLRRKAPLRYFTFSYLTKILIDPSSLDLTLPHANFLLRARTHTRTNTPFFPPGKTRNASLPTEAFKSTGTHILLCYE